MGGVTVDADRDAVLDELEALAGEPIPGLRERLKGLLPHEFDTAAAHWRRELPRAVRRVAIQEAHGGFIAERQRRAAVLSESLVKVLAGPSRTLEENVPLQADHRTGALSVGQWPNLDTDSCRRATPVPGNERLREFLRQVEHLPARLEPFTVEEEVFCQLHGTPHPAALVFAGIEDVEAAGLTPCGCGGDPAKHRYQVKDVRLRILPFIWGPGAEFDAPCPEAEEDVSALVRVGHVKDRQTKSSKDPEVTPTSGPEEILAARLEELASGGGAREKGT